MTTDEIGKWSAEAQKSFKNEVDALFRSVFPRMPDDTRGVWVEDYFTIPGDEIRREAHLYRDESGALTATMLFDSGTVVLDGKALQAIYVLSRAISLEYQGTGLVDRMMRRVFSECSPDLLLTTCAHSSSLHSWIGLTTKGLDSYEAYPRLEASEGSEILITVPLEEAHLVLALFEELYLKIVRGDKRQVDRAVMNMTGNMVRKGIYQNMYDFDPWNKLDREDKIAKALEVTAGDGILLVMKKVR